MGDQLIVYILFIQFYSTFSRVVLNLAHCFFLLSPETEQGKPKDSHKYTRTAQQIDLTSVEASLMKRNMIVVK